MSLDTISNAAATDCPMVPADTDVLVVGGGVMGCAIIYFLASYGVKVCLIERADLNMEASGANAGSLHAQLPSPYFRVQRRDVVERLAPQLVALSLAGIRIWHQLSEELSDNIDFSVHGGLMVAENIIEVRLLEEKMTIERRAGLNTHMLERSDLSDLAPYLSQSVIGAAYCPSEGKLNPLLAATALANGARRLGARIHRYTELRAVKAIANGFVVETGRGKIKCRRLVNAAGVGSMAIAAMIGAKLEGQPRAQHMNVTSPATHFIPHLVQHVGRRLTLKQASNGSVLIGGGLPGYFDPAANHVSVWRQSLEQSLWMAQHIVPGVADLDLIRSWAALSLMTEGPPVLGRLPDAPPAYLHAVPGNSGYTNAAICAKVLAEFISERPSSLDLDELGINLAR